MPKTREYWTTFLTLCYRKHFNKLHSRYLILVSTQYGNDISWCLTYLHQLFSSYSSPARSPTVVFLNWSSSNRVPNVIARYLVVRAGVIGALLINTLKHAETALMETGIKGILSSCLVPILVSWRKLVLVRLCSLVQVSKSKCLYVHTIVVSLRIILKRFLLKQTKNVSKFVVFLLTN